MKRVVRVLLLTLFALLAGAAAAHEMTMAEMEVRQISPREFLWQWTAGGSRPVGDALKPVWPQGCSAEESVLRCGEGGLSGTLAVEGVGKLYSAAMVKIFWRDGPMRVYTITAAQPKVQLFGSAEDKRGMGEIAWAYTVLGVAHILNGWDHLLFVVSLLFLVGFNRQLVMALTAFTLAHSLTLGLSALGWLTLRRPPVEAAIALSIVLVAGEALHKQQTVSRRWPALVAFIFGLVHGLGFAGALKEIGLPQHHLLMALLTFNVGVEVGQLLVVVVGYIVYRTLLMSSPRFDLARVLALYAIGAVAAYWSIGRIVSIVA
jgi:hydrogenase/urease accessory protein HupE